MVVHGSLRSCQKPQYAKQWHVKTARSARLCICMHVWQYTCVCQRHIRVTSLPQRSCRHPQACTGQSALNVRWTACTAHVAIVLKHGSPVAYVYFPVDAPKRAPVAACLEPMPEERLHACCCPEEAAGRFARRSSGCVLRHGGNNPGPVGLASRRARRGVWKQQPTVVTITSVSLTV